ncbi:GNAT family N-acetyltransferase [Mycobacterium sp.]|uniref:GNAT family N-acetyltransferase n=1 Tax=Mycobacterium sp. TaxID=1785 RepID=UPI003A8C1974
MAAVAARTFPLACPPWSRPEDIAAFVDAQLSPECFAAYLSDPRRAVIAARNPDGIAGYVMVIRGVPNDDRIQRAVPLRPAVELSKLYLLTDFHGTGISAALLDAAISAAFDWGARCIWLGANEKNLRAVRFYRKHGFTVTGAKTFQMGSFVEDDYVMVRELS